MFSLTDPRRRCSDVFPRLSSFFYPFLTTTPGGFIKGSSLQKKLLNLRLFSSKLGGQASGQTGGGAGGGTSGSTDLPRELAGLRNRGRPREKSFG